MTWLWSDTLAALLIEHDRVRVDRVLVMKKQPIGYRIETDQDPLELARTVLARLEAAERR